MGAQTESIDGTGNSAQDQRVADMFKAIHHSTRRIFPGTLAGARQIEKMDKLENVIIRRVAVPGNNSANRETLQLFVHFEDGNMKVADISTY